MCVGLTDIRRMSWVSTTRDCLPLQKAAGQRNVTLDAASCTRSRHVPPSASGQATPPFTAPPLERILDGLVDQEDRERNQNSSVKNEAKGHHSKVSPSVLGMDTPMVADPRTISRRQGEPDCLDAHYHSVPQKIPDRDTRTLAVRTGIYYVAIWAESCLTDD